MGVAKYKISQLKVSKYH